MEDETIIEYCQVQKDIAKYGDFLKENVEQLGIVDISKIKIKIGMLCDRFRDLSLEIHKYNKSKK